MQDFKSKHICVVGVSARQDKFGYKIFTGLLQAGYKTCGVNPSDGEVAGMPIFRSLKDLPEKPDIVITVVPHQVTERIVEEAHALGITQIWMQPGSESETAIQKARDYGMDVTHHACFMVRQGIW